MPPSLVPVVVWRRTRDGRDGRTAWAGEAEIRQLGQRVQEAVRGGQPILLPLVAYYGTQRLWRERRQTAARQGLGNRLDGYVDCLDISASERSLTEWMRQRTLEELQQVQTNPGYRHPQLAAVERAVADCVEGVDRFWFDLMHDEVRMASGAKIQTFAMLSDGYRNMVAMVADLAERAAVLNPQMGVDAPRETPGVVLIDEIELHLHPKWQRTVVSSLRRAFPRMQFIATTHSPQVLSTVGRTQVRLFRDNQLVASDLYVGGRDANELLEDIFGVSARPEAMKGELEQLFQFLDDRDFGNARRKLTELEAQLGATDADVVRARWILDTEAGASVLTGS
jgi:predicted ATP-binding protein involved in virulence